VDDAWLQPLIAYERVSSAFTSQLHVLVAHTNYKSLLVCRCLMALLMQAV
jgi:hypothetical protein